MLLLVGAKQEGNAVYFIDPNDSSYSEKILINKRSTESYQELCTYIHHVAPHYLETQNHDLLGFVHMLIVDLCNIQVIDIGICMNTNLNPLVQQGGPYAKHWIRSGCRE